MKVIGLIGGVSWESSAEYYRVINQEVKNKLGAVHSAELLMFSLDFQPVAQLEHAERWDELAILLRDVAKRLEGAGANLLLIASNTLHKLADEIQDGIGIPLLHIADAAAEEITKADIASVGLLGTRFVMEQDFYMQRLSAHGLKVLVPDKGSREYIHKVIYTELSLGQVLDTSRTKLLDIMKKLTDSGAEAVVLGNTELPLLIQAGDTPVLLFDTMAIHAKKAVSWALEESGTGRPRRDRNRPYEKLPIIPYARHHKR